MLPRVRFVLLLLSVLAASVLADYGPRDSVVILTDKNFEKEVLQSPDYWLVEFYAPWWDISISLLLLECCSAVQ